MKKLSVLFLSLVALTATVTSCSKNDNPAPAAAATTLQITVKDQLGVVSGATVTLYKSVADLDAQTNAVGTAPSDASGVVTFNKNLTAAIYYFDVAKGCENNFYGAYATTAALVANTTTKMDVIIAGTGTLTITNASATDSYNIYVTQGGQDHQIGTTAVAAGASETLPLPSGADFAFKAVKLDAQGNPTSTVVNKTVNMTCGGTDTFTFGS